jgi:hypothetical protein
MWVVPKSPTRGIRPCPWMMDVRIWYVPELGQPEAHILARFIIVIGLLEDVEVTACAWVSAYSSSFRPESRSVMNYTN